MRALLALALSATLSLAACGDDSDSSDAEDYADKSPKQIHEDVAEAMGDLESVRMSGTIFDSGQEIEVDVLVNTDGECEGSLDMGDQGSFELIHVDGVSYFKPDEQFWRSQGGGAAIDQLIEMTDGKWVTDTSDPNGFGDLCDLNELVDQLEGDVGDSEVEGTDEIDGVGVVKLSAGDDGFGYVALEEPHHIIRIDLEDEVEVDFSDFDAELDVEKPAASEIFDLASLG